MHNSQYVHQDISSNYFVMIIAGL